MIKCGKVFEFSTAYLSSFPQPCGILLNIVDKVFHSTARVFHNPVDYSFFVVYGFVWVRG